MTITPKPPVANTGRRWSADEDEVIRGACRDHEAIAENLQAIGSTRSQDAIRRRRNRLIRIDMASPLKPRAPERDRDPELRDNSWCRAKDATDKLLRLLRLDRDGRLSLNETEA